MQILLIHCCCFIFRPEGTTTTVSSVVERRAATDRSASDPRWRHSNPDSQYGFRTTPFLQSCQYQQRLYQQQQQHEHEQVEALCENGGCEADKSFEDEVRGLLVIYHPL